MLNKKARKILQDNSNAGKFGIFFNFIFVSFFISSYLLISLLYLADLELNEDVKAESSRSKLRQCGICNKRGHNARTCSNA